MKLQESPDYGKVREFAHGPFYFLKNRMKVVAMMEEKLQEIIKEIGDFTYDLEAGRKADLYQHDLIKPRGSMGRLEDVSIRLAEITGQYKYRIDQKEVIVFCADHGFSKYGVSAFAPDVTKQMTMAYLRGDAAANVVAKANGAQVTVVDMGIDGEIKNPLLINKKIRMGTDDFTQGPAMTLNEAREAIYAGFEVTEGVIIKGAHIIAPGEMGIGNTTSSSALLAVLAGLTAEEATGRGSMINDETWQRKMEIVKKALEINQPDKNDPLGVLAKLGGFEIAGAVGSFMACAKYRVPVVVDGFISTAAAMTAKMIAPGVEKVMFSSHQSAEIQHKYMLELLGLKPLLNLNMRLGEATGASMAMQLIQTASRIITDMGTFSGSHVNAAEKNLEMELDKITR